MTLKCKMFGKTKSGNFISKYNTIEIYNQFHGKQHYFNILSYDDFFTSTLASKLELQSGDASFHTPDNQVTSFSKNILFISIIWLNIFTWTLKEFQSGFFFPVESLYNQQKSSLPLNCSLVLNCHRLLSLWCQRYNWLLRSVTSSR